MAAAAGQRVFDIIDAKLEVADRPDAREVPVIHGQVCFENVSFEYNHSAPTLHEISFTARPGEVIALVGSTGSGKTSLANLIPRFYDVSSGSISIDGIDVRQFTLGSLRRSIGVVLQESVLFATTIRENIRFGSPEAGEQAVIEAARAAQIHDFIMDSALGYDTPVGEKGLTLSGGQKQRVAIARALLKKPRILILDDATSSVDAETERRFQDVLSELMRGRTTFIIAQRQSTLRLADRVMLLEHGRLTAQGRHEELLASSRHYADLCRRQIIREDKP
jgi:ATP-binding cassette subfamily B multidrug efflux pump